LSGVAYEQFATTESPALIVYVLDVSASMSLPLGTRRRIDVVTDALRAAFTRLIFRSTKGARVAPRYRLALFAYSDHVYDLLDGVRTITEVAPRGLPELSPLRTTDTERALLEVEKLLQSELLRHGSGPAPLVCHMTDGEYTAGDPEPVAERIKAMQSQDGGVLVENIFISDAFADPQMDPRHWSGVDATTRLLTPYAEKLRRMSSPLPRGYRRLLIEDGYAIGPGALMMLPGTSPELVELGFVMSTATPVAH
jgi:hypothetical protein